MDDLPGLIREISIESIKRAQFQTREIFEEQAIAELADSIKEVGLLQPPVVQEISKDLYELIAGERRLTALRLLGHTTVRVLVKKTTLEISAKATLVENLQRVDLNPIEVAEGLKRLIDEFDYTQAELSKSIGKKRSTVANYLRLLHLPKEIQQSVKQGLISMAHAKLLVSCPEEKQLSLFKKIVYESLTVKKTQELSVSEEKKRGQARDSFLGLKEMLEQKLGTKVEILSRGNAGTISISFYGEDDLHRVLEAFNLLE